MEWTTTTWVGKSVVPEKGVGYKYTSLLLHRQDLLWELHVHESHEILENA